MKITYEEAAYIRRYEQKHFMEKHFCDWYLEKTKMFLCMWDGGLKEFGFEPRECHHSCVMGFPSDDSSTMFGRFKEVWDKHSRE